MPPIEIRDAHLADMAALREIYRRASWSNEGDRAALLANPAWLEFSDVAVREQRTRVAVTSDRIAGFATTLVTEHGLELEDLFVDPDWMRRGVARELTRDVRTTARAQGFGRVEVTANRHALAFYEKVGFIIDGEIAREFGTALRMHLAV